MLSNAHKALAFSFWIVRFGLLVHTQGSEIESYIMEGVLICHTSLEH